ncbi:MAG: MauE/DoxX family redox-associated membrane protein [Haliea sp.]|uniref:MauE/DoxX family redox-associated membrane protein n=1 Tax=Haliea sp. TaxID=1932666 RepID=UPI0032F04E05
MMLPDVVGIALAGFLAWLLATAGVHKLRHPAQFSELAAQYLPQPLRPLWRDQLVSPVGILEVAIALALLLPQTRAAAALLAATLLTGYALMMAWQLAQGRRDLRCGCAGPASDVLVSPALVLRNLLTAALTLLLALPAGPFAVSASGILLALCMAGFLIGLYLAAEQLISNSQHMVKSR